LPEREIHIFWFRRDLRLEDNVGLYHALKIGKPVLPIFIFDTEILSRLEDKHDRRVDFIHQIIHALQTELLTFDSSLQVFYDSPEETFRKLIEKHNTIHVYTNHDYEPYAIERDLKIKNILESLGSSFHSFKDQVIFEKSEITKDDGKPYTIFTPYSRKWKQNLNAFHYKAYPVLEYASAFIKTPPFPIPTLNAMGFSKTDISFIRPDLPQINLLKAYKEQRDFPAIAGTSRLSMHLRFGTISIRKLVQHALQVSESWLNELIWREFYMMILWHFPHVVNSSFKKEYDLIPWSNNESHFKKWREGKTGFPIVDAGMRELNTTGYMHNRVRMIVSSFLVKDLLIDWRWGEAYFASKLNDFDLSANNGGWQWAAGSGCDAAPYFRIFNPYEQQKKFDPSFAYIKHWLPEFGTTNYPQPLVDHALARNRTLQVYKEALAVSRQTKLF
jgi:deoxyribodipyrimidine photo-lyase